MTTFVSVAETFRQVPLWLRRYLPLLTLALICLSVPRMAQAQTGTCTCRATISVVWSEGPGEEDRHTSRVESSWSPVGSGGHTHVVKIRVKYYRAGGQEIDINGNDITDPEAERWEEELIRTTAMGYADATTNFIASAFDGYNYVWTNRPRVAPRDAVSCWYTYRVYGSAGSQSAQASAETNKAQDPPRFVRFDDPVNYPNPGL